MPAAPVLPATPVLLPVVPETPVELPVVPATPAPLPVVPAPPVGVPLPPDEHAKPVTAAKSTNPRFNMTSLTV
jgi:hypothetical protein